jgi:hypothetical protein
MVQLILTRMSFAVPAALAISFALGPARAGPIDSTTSCVGGYGVFSCSTTWGKAGDPYIRSVPSSISAEQSPELVERDRKWIARCRPVIVHDRYGVSRYHYAAPGCEFGVIDAGAGAASQ